MAVFVIKNCCFFIKIRNLTKLCVNLLYLSFGTNFTLMYHHTCKIFNKIDCYATIICWKCGDLFKGGVHGGVKRFLSCLWEQGFCVMSTIYSEINRLISHPLLQRYVR